MKLHIPRTYPLWVEVSHVPILDLDLLSWDDAVAQENAIRFVGGKAWFKIGTITITDTEAIK